MMPQFDSFTFVSQLFWLFFIFWIFYILFSYYLLPTLAVIYKIRKRKKLDFKIADKKALVFQNNPFNNFFIKFVTNNTNLQYLPFLFFNHFVSKNFFNNITLNIIKLFYKIRKT